MTQIKRALIPMIAGLLSACGPGILGPCPDSPVLTVLPFSAADMGSVAPLGQLNPPSHTLPTDHMYFNYTTPGSKKLTIYAPGDMVITQVLRAAYSNRTYPYDYTIDFGLCHSLTGRYAHVLTLEPRLLEKMGDLSDCSSYSTADETLTNCKSTKKVSLKAGDVIGYGGEVAAMNGMDFGIRDSRVSNSFINTDRNKSYVHSASPYNYYTAALKQVIASKLISNDSVTRVAEPLGGEIAYDVAGTAQGSWFKVGGSGFEEGHALALAKDNYLPGILAFSISQLGTAQDSKVLFFSTQSSGNVRAPFTSVSSVGTVYCYDSLYSDRVFQTAVSNTIALLQLQSNGQLLFDVQTAASCGSGPWAMSASAVTLER